MEYSITIYNERDDGTPTPQLRPHDGGTPSSVQQSQESLTVLAARYGINEKTVAKWRVRGAGIRGCH